MADKFIVRPKGAEKKEDTHVLITLRIEREIREKFDQLSSRSDRSRNELMGMALRYALDHLEFIPDTQTDS